MILLSQFKDKTTQSLELNIVPREVPRNKIIPVKIYEDYKKVIRKEDDFFSLKELKGLEKFMNINLFRQVYCIVENNSERIFGTYASMDTAKEELKNICKNPYFYEMSIDEELYYVEN